MMESIDPPVGIQISNPVPIGNSLKIGEVMKNFKLQVIIYFLLSFPFVRAQWIEQIVPGDITVALGIDFIDQDNGVMGGWHFNFAGEVFGNSYYTSDAGTNWIETNIPDSMRVLIGEKLFTSNLGYGFGAYNLLTSSVNQKKLQQDKNLNPFVQKYYEKLGMDFYLQQEYRGYFVETTDGGLNWHPKGSFEDSVYYLVGMSFINQLTGFLLAMGPTSNTAAILKTVDGGVIWNYVYLFENNLSLRDIKFYDQSNGIAVGSTDNNGVVLRSVDGGDNWEKIILPDFAAANQVTYLNNNTLLISGTNSVFQGVVYKSIDGGISWQEYKNYGNMVNVNTMNSLPASGTILISGDLYQSGLSMPFTDISIDNGLTWHYAQLSEFQIYSTLNSKIVDYSRWYITGTKNAITNGFVLYTDNAAGVPVELVSFSAEASGKGIHLKWITASELNNLGFEVERALPSTTPGQDDWVRIGFVEGKGTTTEIQNYFYTDDLYGVNELKFYYRLKQIDFNGTYGYSEEIEIEGAPRSFGLGQNFPNPFNPFTTIKYEIPESRFVTIKVYDVLGKEVAILVNEEKPVGEYEVEFIGNNFPSGIYFYQLQAGSFVKTKKMILLK
jgi:photosystem II stability/assembly factor-like uncharacterized protein